MKSEKKFPTIVGLLILFVGLVAGVQLTGNGLDLRSKASGDCQPVNPQIANITNNSADISFLTTAECLVDLSLDNRTISGDQIASKIHYFQVASLKENTAYPYRVVSGGQVFQGNLYTFTTAAKPSGSIPTSNLAWGKVVNSSGKAVPGSIVYLTIPGASLLSSKVTSGGNWNISLANSFNEAKTSWFSPELNQDEDIVVISPDGTTTSVTANTSINNPVPDIVVGQNGALTDDAQRQSQGIVPTGGQPSNSTNLSVVNPSDGESLSTLKPDFFGAAPANTQIIVKVESPVVYNGQTSADSSGNWHWSPPSNLTPGEHTLTVSVTNPQTGLIETVQKKFIVLAADNNLAFSSSPSATSITPSPTQAPLVTSAPTATLAPTNTPTLVLTSTPAPTIRTAKPSTTSAVPVTGNFSFTYVYLLLAAGLITSSYLLLTKK